MVLGGIGATAYYVVTHQDPARQPPIAAADTTTAEGLAKAVISRLNRRDLDGVIALTCSQGKATGRRELTKAVPALDPQSAPDVRNAAFEFELGEVHEVPEGYRAGIVVHHAGVSQDGSMRIQRDGDNWALCGLDSPRIGGTGLIGSG
jgi:hypothetical protein